VNIERKICRSCEIEIVRRKFENYQAEMQRIMGGSWKNILSEVSEKYWLSNKFAKYCLEVRKLGGRKLEEY
jgi:hypothetical protein